MPDSLDLGKSLKFRFRVAQWDQPTDRIPKRRPDFSLPENKSAVMLLILKIQVFLDSLAPVRSASLETEPGNRTAILSKQHPLATTCFSATFSFNKKLVVGKAGSG
jgi:hypothetical protein